jgi:RNA polymerase sigma-70 factor (ECF subfamily)
MPFPPGPADQLLFQQALARLSPGHRAVLAALHLRGDTAAAARRLAIPEGTVKSRAHYAVGALRQAIRGVEVASAPALPNVDLYERRS